jgi:ABC-type nitrate/sulfonate/bicarbonate transport system substrate-binding protein
MSAAVALRRVAVTVALGLVGAACNSSAGTTTGTTRTASAPVAVNVQYFPGSFYTWLVDLADKGGFFRDNGIAAHMVGVAGGESVAFAGLAHGSVDLVMGDTTVAGPLIDHGVALKVVTGSSSGGWLLVAPQSQPLPLPYPGAAHALAGKTLGVGTIGTSSYFYGRLLVTEAGLPADGVTFAALGANPADLVSAIDSHRVAAAMVDPVTAYLLVKLQHNQAVISIGEHQVSIFGASTDPLKLLPADSPLRAVEGVTGGGAWEFTTAAFAKDHPDTVKRIQLALEETDVWMHNPANLQTVARDLESGGNIPRFIVQAGAEFPFLQAILPLSGSYVSPKAIGAFQAFWLGQGLLTKSVPVNQWYVPGLPQSPDAVVSDVRAAGRGNLGSSA